jgi:dUTP pyrophosphatase
MTAKQVERKSAEVLFVNRLSEDIALPRRATDGSAGFDLFCPKSLLLMPGVPTRIPTKLQLFIPKTCYGKLEGRSSLGTMGIIVLGGVIDSDYCAEVSVILVNVSGVPVKILAGEAFVQLILIKIASPPGVTDCSGLGISRGGGFGSTNAY